MDSLVCRNRRKLLGGGKRKQKGIGLSVGIYVCWIEGGSRLRSASSSRLDAITKQGCKI